MAVAFDQNLGSSDANTAVTFTIVTTAVAAAGSRIVVYVSFWNTNAAASVLSVNDGAAYARDKSTDNGSDVFEMWSRHAAGGLASGSTITITLTGTTGTGGALAGAESFTGVPSSGALDTTAGATGTGTSWSSGSAINALADSVFAGGAGNETATSTTSTPTSGTEVHDRWRTGDAQGFASGYILASSVASQSIGGTWVGASSTATTGALAIYSGTGGGAAAQPVWSPPRMPLGV